MSDTIHLNQIQMENLIYEFRMDAMGISTKQKVSEIRGEMPALSEYKEVFEEIEEIIGNYKSLLEEDGGRFAQVVEEHVQAEGNLLQ